jgi:hypothetical protein
MCVRIHQKKKRRQTMNNKKKKSVVIFFVLHCTELPPYYVLWISCFSQQDSTNAFLSSSVNLFIISSLT